MSLCAVCPINWIPMTLTRSHSRRYPYLVQRGAFFLEPILRNGDLRAAWPAVHCDFRTCMGQNWLHANRQQLNEHGYGRDEVLAKLVEDESQPPTVAPF